VADGEAKIFIFSIAGCCTDIIYQFVALYYTEKRTNGQFCRFCDFAGRGSGETKYRKNTKRNTAKIQNKILQKQKA
jgi:hypothetical protein